MKTLRAATSKPIVLKPVHPNLGVEAAYRVQVESLVDAMNKSILYWITAAYRANPPAMAQDATPADALIKVMRKLGRRWIRQFDEAAKKIAEEFATKTRDVAEKSMQRLLREAGFTVPFTPTPAMRDALDAVVGENVALIKSIPSEQFTKIETAVMRSVQAGRDLKTLQDELIGLGAKSKNRAALIARDQATKATAAMSKARRLSLGLTKSKWKHSRGGVHPRKSHMDADGTVYETAVGCLIDGEYIMPGEKINCRCQAQAIIPGFDDD
jgi:uncharacterized protein with gpF-like domain